MGIASVFVGITVLMMVVGLAVNPFFLFVALPFGGSAYLMWYQASGKLAEKMRREAASGQFNAEAASEEPPAASERESTEQDSPHANVPVERDRPDRTVDGPDASRHGTQGSQQARHETSSESRPRQASPI